ncbi:MULTISPECIES: LexA family transcriptional regulator [Myxococcus]|nr:MULTISPECIES: helix-turn-helix domain-containing protein [Myxococcus]
MRERRCSRERRGLPLSLGGAFLIPGLLRTQSRTGCASASFCRPARPPAHQPRSRITRGGLAFIYAYTKLNRRPPAVADMQRYFGTTPPTVYRMVLELERRGLIRRSAGQARSIELLLAPELLPALH